MDFSIAQRNHPTCTTRQLLQEGDIVALSREYLRLTDAPAELRLARGRLTLIEHEGGVPYGCVTWDYPGIDDRLNLTDMILARDIGRSL